MTIEIHNPDLVRRLNLHIRTGQFQDADDLIDKALDALDEHRASFYPSNGETGAVVLAALQASPYKDIDLTPPRARPGNLRDVVL